jgi:hypothetical protein
MMMISRSTDHVVDSVSAPRGDFKLGSYKDKVTSTSMAFIDNCRAVEINGSTLYNIHGDQNNIILSSGETCLQQIIVVISSSQ